MLHGRSPLAWAIGGAVLWLRTANADAVGAAAAADGGHTPSARSSSLTCPSRTINYITETLPQQCLRTDWSSNATATETQYGFIIITTDEGDQPSTIVARQDDRSPVAHSDVNGEKETPRPETSIHPPTASQSTPAQGSESTHVATNAEAADEEADPLLDPANFVSFEEWKAKMLEKSGQAPEQIAKDNKDTKTREEQRQGGTMHRALESLGDDEEIELDFGGFVDPDSVASALPSAKIPSAEEIPEAEPDAGAAGISRRSESAGETSKERPNLASFDCSATVRKTNPECKGANYILSENKDSYMLNPCAVKNKFFIVELCNDLLIDTIALANYEFFSSTFRQIRFSISQKYPVKSGEWRELGTFEAQNRRELQAFSIENSPFFGKYLRVEILNHYGSEHYCPVSLIRVHGMTWMEEVRDFKKEEAEAEAEVLSTADNAGEATQTQKESDHLQKQWQQGGDAAAENRGGNVGEIVNGKTVPVDASQSTQHSSNDSASVAISEDRSGSQFPRNLPNCHGPGDFSDKCPRTNYHSPLLEQFELFTSNCKIYDRFCNMELTQKISVASRAASWTPLTTTIVPAPSDSSLAADGALMDHEPARVPPSTSPPSSPAATRSTKADASASATNDRIKSTADNTESKNKSNTTSTYSSSNNGTAGANNTVHSSSRSPTQHAPAATPSTQESFFKSVHKRLQVLESNSTLSLQYIEEQSRLLREAFTKVEKRQLSKTSNFLASLNETVLSELREFRKQYEQIWQSTILELSSQREQSVKEAGALSARLAILADEVVWQKRLVYLQFGLIMLSVLAFIFFQSPVGGESQRYLEIPVLRDLLTRSPPATGSRYRRPRPRAGTSVSLRSDSGVVFDSPPSSPSRPISRSSLSWAQVVMRSSPSEEESDELLDQPGDEPSCVVQSPTPPPEQIIKANGSLDPVQNGANGNSLDPEPEATLRRAMSSPALGREDAQDDEEGELSSPTDPPRVAELAREAGSKDGADDGLGLASVTDETAEASIVS